MPNMIKHFMYLNITIYMQIYANTCDNIYYVIVIFIICCLHFCIFAWQKFPAGNPFPSDNRIQVLPHPAGISVSS